MPKQKTHKGTVKRIKITPKGKLLHRHPYGNHFLSKKSSSRKRRQKGFDTVTGSPKKNIKRLLGE